MAKKTNKKQKENPDKGRLRGLMTSSQFKALSGVLLSVFSLALLMGLISFFFTGENDQSFIRSDNGDVRPENWTGSFGAVLSDWLINGLFGISALVVPFLLMIFSFMLLGIKVRSQMKCIIYPLLILIWLPVTLTLVFSPLTETSFIRVGGAYGEMMDNLLRGTMGLTGEILILAGSFVCFGMVAFGWHKFLNGKTFSIPNIVRKHEDAEPVDSPCNQSCDKADDDAENDVQPLVCENETEQVTEPEEPGDNIIFINGNDDKSVSDDDNSITIETAQPAEDDIFDVREDDDININNDRKDIPEDIIIDEGDDGPLPEQRDLLAELGPYDPTLDLENYRFPQPELLKDFSNQNAGVSLEEQQANQQKIISTLRNFKIGIKKIVETIGPTVTLFEIVPEDGVRISRIQGLEKDIMLSLSAMGIRLIAPIPGKGTVGIEVPNSKPKTVGMRPLILSPKFKESTAELPVVMGRTITNGVFMFDLAKTPHLIVAGATGQGKSVGLNAIITSLLYKKHPSQVKFVLIDPKQLEFSIYRDIERHYLAKLPDADDAVITDSKKVIETLEAVCQEMEDRYYLLSIAKVRNIVEYNRKFVERKLNPSHGHRYLPYIVVIVDEFGDLIATEGKKIETPIQRITQKARAAGIHMILATQRPSVNVITGVIKANCPTRIAFRVISQIDSKTILDCSGAEQLIGRGDMLYSKGDVPERVQCAFVDTPEVEEIVAHIKSQQAYPDAYALPEPKSDESAEGGEKEFSIRHCDSLFNEVAEYVVNSQLGSTSNLQRKFEIGFNRAGKLMDQLEGAGIVGPARGAKPREVLVKNIDDLNALISSYIS